MSIGSRIKEARERQGYSQVQLAELLKISKGAVGNYERDLSSPKDTILFNLCKVLKVDPNYIFQDEMKNPPTEKPQEDNVHNIIDAIPKEDRKIYDLLYEIFVRMGFVKEGEELTPEQVDFCAHMLGLIESAFRRKEIDHGTISSDIG